MDLRAVSPNVRQVPGTSNCIAPTLGRVPETTEGQSRLPGRGSRYPGFSPSHCISSYGIGFNLGRSGTWQCYPHLLLIAAPIMDRSGDWWKGRDSNLPHVSLSGERFPKAQT